MNLAGMVNIQPIYGNIEGIVGFCTGFTVGLPNTFLMCLPTKKGGHEVFRQTDVSSLKQQTWEFKSDIGYSTKLFGIEST